MPPYGLIGMMPNTGSLINASPRSEHTCPGEMSKSYRLAQIAQSVFLNEHARVDLLRQGAEEGTLRRNQIVRGPVSSLFLSQGATGMASEKNLQELFHDTLKDIYFAEKKDPERFAENAESCPIRGAKIGFSQAREPNRRACGTA
jgi:hypothetical protein